MKKAIVFIGSARKGDNMDTLVNELIKDIDKSKIDIEVHYLDKIKINGCRGCLYCKSHPASVLMDDMSDIYKV